MFFLKYYKQDFLLYLGEKGPSWIEGNDPKDERVETAHLNPHDLGERVGEVMWPLNRTLAVEWVRHAELTWEEVLEWAGWSDEFKESATDMLTGGEGSDVLAENTEHPDSIGTPSMEDVQSVVDRTWMSDMWEEEPAPWESGEEVKETQITNEQKAERVSALEIEAARIQNQVSQYPEWSTERQKAEREMSAIQMLLNILQYGSVNPPTWTVDGQWNPVENGYSGGIGQPLSPELLAQYGPVWHELASWIHQRGYPVFEWQPNYCGKNVGECMNAFGYQWLPNSGRNGADWKTICEQRPNQFKKIDCRPENAPAGALISYARNSGGSAARQASGHIEIALGEGRWYYYGAVASQPGGSQKPPREGSYSIFMPTSKV